MANQRWQKHSGGGPAKPGKGHVPDSTPERTKNWPGLPGKTQPKVRDHGYRKVKPGPAHKGIC